MSDRVTNQSKVATTVMSARGQVVVPDKIRKAFGWDAGTVFTVVSSADALIFKPIKRPDKGEFDTILADCQREAEAANLTPADIEEAIKAVREEKLSR